MPRDDILTGDDGGKPGAGAPPRIAGGVGDYPLR